MSMSFHVPPESAAACVAVTPFPPVWTRVVYDVYWREFGSHHARTKLIEIAPGVTAPARSRGTPPSSV